MANLPAAAAAAAVFRHVESVAGNDPSHASLLARNRALECIVGKDHAAAVREYERCIEADPADAVAVNNKALCLLYSQEVVNLCSMYELAFVNHVEVSPPSGIHRERSRFGGTSPPPPPLRKEPTPRLRDTVLQPLSIRVTS
ncbi:hypothetical protein GUJ93_ZPchr0002g25522 [Zizania palustris]|uniref:Uncharacterized protein n=1 Tax=Zizania palustris TaxID=103762 RepID=A0A8J5RVK7_ZIZPA|nr:hypothetical protein GUJ93_ZPchr0002g25522 [Zizania palustris]